MPMGHTIREQMIASTGFTSIESVIGSYLLGVTLRNCYRPHDGPHHTPGDTGWALRPHAVVMHNNQTDLMKITFRIMAVPYGQPSDISLYSSWKYLFAHNGIAYFEVTVP